MPISLLIKTRTPLQKFSKSLVSLKYLQFIQNDLEKFDTSKKARKIWYLNQSYIFHLVALWEVFIEEEITFGYEEIIGLSSSGIFEPMPTSKLEDLPKSFRTPNKDNIDRLFAKFLGIKNISRVWSWENMTREVALDLLKEILNTRHEIAHGGNTEKRLSFDKNFEYMKHLYNLAYLTEHEVDRHLARLSGSKFSHSIEVPYPLVKKM